MINELTHPGKFTEEELEQRAPYLGGLVETGGSVGFSVTTRNKNGRIYSYSYPFLQYADKRIEPIKILLERFGGTSNKERGNSYQWSIKGVKGQVPFIAALVMPFTPSRREVLLAISNWEQTDDAEERVEIARSVKGYSRIEHINSEDYKHLVQNTGFVAGVIDGRAATYEAPRIERSRTQFTTRVHSSNRSLLEALKERYGGGIHTYWKAGEAKLINGRIISPRHNLAYWAFWSETLDKLTSLTKPHLLLKKIVDGRVVINNTHTDFRVTTNYPSGYNN